MKGRPVRGAVSGLFFGLSLSVLLLTTGIVPLDSVLLAVLPVVFLLLGIVVGISAPLKRGQQQASAPSAP